MLWNNKTNDLLTDSGFDSIPSKPKRGKPRQETQEVPENTITPETPLLNNEELEMVETIESLFSKYQKSCKELTDFSNIHFSMGRPYNFMKSIAILRKILLSLSYRINMVNGCIKFSEEDLVKNAKFKTLINETVLRKKTMINTSKSIRVRNEAANGVKTIAETYRERRAVRAAIQLLAEIMECYERCKECYKGCKMYFEESGMEAGEVVMRVEGEMEKIGEEVMMMNFVMLGQCVPH